MGGDNAPHEIIAGAQKAIDNHGIPVLLVGKPEVLETMTEIPVLPASEIIEMDAEPGSSVRQMKDSSLVRAAEAVRDGVASAMVSAGNTGATMASALLRMGRIKILLDRRLPPYCRHLVERQLFFWILGLIPSATQNGCFNSVKWVQFLHSTDSA